MSVKKDRCAAVTTRKTSCVSWEGYAGCKVRGKQPAHVDMREIVERVSLES